MESRPVEYKIYRDEVTGNFGVTISLDIPGFQDREKAKQFADEVKKNHAGRTLVKQNGVVQ